MTATAPKDAGPDTSVKSMLGRNWGWLVAAGVALVVLGVVAIAAPLFSSLAINAWIGLVFLFAGGARVVQAFDAGRRRHLAGTLIVALAYIVGGLLILFNPLAGLIAFSLFIVAMLVVSGAVQLWAGLATRPEPGWGWSVFGGLLALIAAAVIFASFPGAAAWLLGFMAGISFLFEGWALLILGMTARSAARG